MKLTLNELKANLYQIVDQVIKTGIPVEIERHGHQVMLILEKPKNKLANLCKHPNVIIGNDKNIHVNWLKDWYEKDNL